MCLSIDQLMTLVATTDKTIVAVEEVRVTIAGLAAPLPFIHEGEPSMAAALARTEGVSRRFAESLAKLRRELMAIDRRGRTGD